MYQCVIVGGGIHGTACLGRLLADTSLEREDLLVVDPHDRLLESFRRKAAACEMDALRSPYVHHIGTDPFGLESFAQANDREDNLEPTPGYPRRPSLELFCEYADVVIERHDLETFHRQASVQSIAEVEGGLLLETDRGSIATRTCLLAIGHGGRYCRPSWAEAIPKGCHVWDEGFDPREIDGDVVVVGGGITAGQLAGCLADRVGEQSEVTLLTRHAIERAVIEADPRWLNWNYIERHLHRHPPGSPARLETIADARNDGTMPPWVHDRLENCVEVGTLTVHRGDVDIARERTDGRTSLRLENGRQLETDQVVLATGFEPVFSHPFVDRIATALALERGARGIPVLDDTTLAWERRDGSPSPLFITGSLAAGTVGPVAGTVVGARRSADRITDALESVCDQPAPDVEPAVAVS